MKLVVDTNVLVPGTLWANKASRLIDALLDGTATLCISAPLIAEFEEVIQREKFQTRLGQSGCNAPEIVSRFQNAALIFDPKPIRLPAALRDPDDVHVLACAVMSGADAIVTGDKDVLAIESFTGIPILTVPQALQKLEIAAE